MFTIYAIDCDGHEHGYAAGDCATLDEAMQCLDELIYEGSLESEVDDPFFVRYGITFDHDGAAEIAQRIAATKPAPQTPCAPPGCER